MGDLEGAIEVVWDGGEPPDEIADALHERGVELVTVESGTEPDERLTNGGADAIVVDSAGSNSREHVAQFSEHADVPIVFYTGRRNP